MFTSSGGYCSRSNLYLQIMLFIKGLFTDNCSYKLKKKSQKSALIILKRTMGERLLAARKGNIAPWADVLAGVQTRAMLKTQTNSPQTKNVKTKTISISIYEDKRKFLNLFVFCCRNVQQFDLFKLCAFLLYFTKLHLFWGYLNSIHFIAMLRGLPAFKSYNPSLG